MPRDALSAGDPRSVSRLRWRLRRTAPMALVAGIAACGATRPPAADAEKPVPTPAPAGGARERIPTPRADAPVELSRRPVRIPYGLDGLGPEILLPAEDSRDEEVARAGNRVLYKRHVYDRFLEEKPAYVRQLVEQMQLDVLVAREARRLGVTLNPETVAARIQEEERTLREQVARELGERMGFGEYLQRNFGMDEAEFRRWLRLVLARRMYRDYVLRFLALREDRVQVRYIVHSDRGLLEDIARRVRAGADFATLAVRHSQDDVTGPRGGLLPPFGRSFRHPVTEVAFRLEPGQLSEVFADGSSGVERYYLVYCLRKLPGRDVDFASVRAELDRAIRERPLDAADLEAAYGRLRRTADLRR